MRERALSWPALDSGGWRESGCLGEIRGEVPSERVEEGYDLADLGVGQRDTQLHAAHHPHRFGERGHRSIVKIGWSHGDVSETRDFEHVQVGGILRESEPALVDLLTSRRLPVLFHEPELLEHLATNTNSVMAGGTAAAHEPPEAGLGHWRQRLRIPPQERIEGRRAEKRALVGTDRVPDVRRRDWLGLAGKRLAEERRIAFDRLELCRDGRMVGLPRAKLPDQGLLGLIFETLPVAPPVLHEVEPGVQDRRRIARVRQMLDTDRSGKGIGAIQGGLVTGGTAHVPVDRPTGIEEEHPPESYARRGGGQVRSAQCLG